MTDLLDPPIYGVAFDKAHAGLRRATATLFAGDPRVRSVGIGRYGTAYGYRVVRNTQVIVAQDSAAPGLFDGVPVCYRDAAGEVLSMVLVPHSGAGAPGPSSTIPEVQKHRHVVCGVQVQNYDADERAGTLAEGLMRIGSLGCFVELPDGSPALLSNRHVLVDAEAPRPGDRILQPGSPYIAEDDQIATLHSFADLEPSAPDASAAFGTARLNRVDAAAAVMKDGIQWVQGFLPLRELPPPTSTAAPRLDDQVVKVGRTTGLTRGVVVNLDVTVGPVYYPGGQCWFEDVFEVEGLENSSFSDSGDSGAIVMRTNGEIVGLLFAGNGQQTYAVPIHTVFDVLGCRLWRQA